MPPKRGRILRRKLDLARRQDPGTTARVPLVAAPIGEAHAPLAGSMQASFGNNVVLSALSTGDTALDTALHSALSLAVAGVDLGTSTDDLWTRGSPVALPGPVARRASGDALAPDAEARLSAALHRGGAPLPAPILARLSAAFGGADLSGVRVHTDAAAAAAAAAISARAFTVGQDVFFGAEGMHPETADGLELLAHEITHVIQHLAGRLGGGGGGLAVSSPTDATEVEAERRAAEVVATMPAIDAGPADGLADVEPWSYLGMNSDEAIQSSDGSAAAVGAGPVSRGEDETAKAQKPSIAGQKLGRWQEITGADLIGGEEIPPPSKEETGFTSYQEALAWGQAKVADLGADGGVVLKQDERYYLFTLVVKSWSDDFSRANVESGLDKVSADGPAGGLVEAYLTCDGHVVRPTVSRVNSADEAIYVVDRGSEGSTWHPTTLPDATAYDDIAAKAKEGADLELGEEGALALFRGMLKSKAIARVNANRAALDKLETKYGRGDNEQDPKWERLRRLSAADKRLADVVSQTRWERGLATMTAAELSRYGGGQSGPELELLTQTWARIDAYNALEAEIGRIRATLREHFPELGALDTSDVTKDTTASQLSQEMMAAIAEARQVLDDVHTKIHEEDMPLASLGPIVESVQAELGITDETAAKQGTLAAHVRGWLQSESRTESIITWTGTVLSVVLGVGAILASGGWALVLGAGGAGVGLGTAAYEFERADDLNDAAHASDIGGQKLVADPDAAKFNYIMGWVNLVLSGLDVGITVHTANGMMKSAKLAERMAGSVGGEVLAQIDPADLSKIERAAKLEGAGKLEDAEAILGPLRGKLGAETVDAARGLFARTGAVDALFGASKALDDSAKRALAALPEKALAEVAALGDDFAVELAGTVKRLLGEADPAVVLSLCDDLGPLALNRLANHFSGPELTALLKKLGPEELRNIAQKGLDEATAAGLRRTAVNHTPTEITGSGGKTTVEASDVNDAVKAWRKGADDVVGAIDDLEALADPEAMKSLLQGRKAPVKDLDTAAQALSQQLSEQLPELRKYADELRAMGDGAHAEASVLLRQIERLKQHLAQGLPPDKFTSMLMQQVEKARKGRGPLIKVGGETFQPPPIGKLPDVGESMVDIEGRFDVLARKTSSSTRRPGAIQEVDLALLDENKGFADFKGSIGPEGKVSVAEGQSERVYSVGHKGALEFQGGLSNQGGERAYGVLYPKGWVERYGDDMRKMGPSGGTAREPNATEFASGSFQEGGKNIPINQEKAFLIRAEESTSELGQVSMHFDRAMMEFHGEQMSMLDFLRKSAIGVVEFDLSGNVVYVNIF